MSAPAFTPGPWIVRPNDGAFLVVHQFALGDGSLVTEFVAQCSGRPTVPNEANARLIAASPTMAEYIQRKAAEGDEEAARIMELVHAGR